MKKRNRVVALLLSVLLIAFSLTACTSKNSMSAINVEAMKGPTLIGTLKMMDTGTGITGNNQYNVTVSEQASAVAASLTNGEIDIAALPVNTAATLYQKTNGNIKLLAVNTLGTLSVVSNGIEINSVSDLKGKTIYLSGQGSSPEYVFDYILETNGIDPKTDVNIEYVQDHTTLATELSTGKIDLAVVPEPYTTMVLNENPEVKIALDLNEEWSKIPDNNSQITMGCMVTTKDYADSHQSEIDSFLNDYDSSVDFANIDIQTTAELCEKYGVMSQDVAVQAIPKCNIVDIQGTEMKQAVEGFLTVLYNQNPSSVGGNLPDENFYYQG